MIDMKYSSLVCLSMMVLVIALFSILLPQIASAQPAEEWNKTYGGQNVDGAYSVQQTSEGGYILAGQTYSYGAGGSDVYLIKTDSKGAQEWSQTFGGKNLDGAFSVQQTSDEGYIITGVTYSFGAGDADVYLVKTDSRGNEEWSRTYGGPNYDHGHTVHQTSDGGYIIAGITLSFGSNSDFGSGGDFYIIKTDSKGIKEWSKTYGGSSVELAFSIQQTSDGGYIVAGGTKSFGPGEIDFYLVKTDPQGKIEWSRNYGKGEKSVAHSVHQTSDGGYIAAGLMQPAEKDNSFPYLIKTDSQGRLEWGKAYNEISLKGSPAECSGSSFQPTLDGGYIFTARTGYLPCYLIKIDSFGTLKWEMPFYGPDICAVQQTSDRGYIAAGFTSPEHHLLEDIHYTISCDFYLAKFFCEKNIPTSYVPTPAPSFYEEIRRLPYVNFYLPQRHISIGEEVVVCLSVLNPITSPGELVVDLSLDIPKGWSVTSSGFSHTEKGLWKGSYEMGQGSNLRVIYVHVLPNEPSQKKVCASVNYYFVGHPEAKISQRKAVSITVYPSGEKPLINLYMPKEEVNVGEEAPLCLSISNPNNSPGSLMVDFQVLFDRTAPAWVIESDGKLKGIFDTEWRNIYKISSGTYHRVIEVPLLSREPTVILSGISVEVKYHFIAHPETIYTVEKKFYIRSLPASPSKTKQPTPPQGEQANEPYIDLYGHKVDVSLGEEIILSLSAINPVTSCDTLNVQLTLVIPSGWSVTTSGFNYAGAGGLWTSSYEIEQGANARTIYVHVLPNEPSQQTVFAHIDYYFAEEPELKHHVDKELRVAVHPVTSSVEYGNGWLEYPKRLVQIIKQAIVSLLS